MPSVPTWLFSALTSPRSDDRVEAVLARLAVEPNPAGHPFQGEERIVLSPHIGGVTADAYVRMGAGAVENLLAVLRG